MSYVGSSAAVIPVGFSGVNSQSFNGDGSTVAFTLNRPVSAVNAIEVMVNNVQQSPYDGSYSVSSTTLTFSAAPSSGTANIYVVYRDFPVGSITDTGAVQKSGDTMTGNLIVNANVGIGTSSPAYKLDVAGTLRLTGESRFDNGINLKTATLNYVYFDDAVSFTRNGTGERMRIDSSGNVGIGTSSPGQRLEVSNSSTNTTFSTVGNQLLLRNSGSTVDAYARIDFAGGSSNNPTASIAAQIKNYGTGATDLVFGTCNTGTGTIAERARIDSSGNLLVGTTSASVSPAHHLIQADNELNLAGATTQSTIYFNYRAGTTLTALRFMNGSGSTSYVACYGTSFTNSSDYRIKTDVQEVGSVLEKVAQLRPLNYIKEGVIGREFGLIAHEAQAVFPDIVSGEKDAVDEDGDMEIQGIDYAQLSTILVKAIQEQQAIIESLTARVSALEGN